MELCYAQVILSGMVICGVRFGPLLSLILEPSPQVASSDLANGEASLLLSSRWKLVSTDEFQKDKDLTCEALSREQQLNLLSSCADETIVDVDLSLEGPTLILFLSNAKTMVINGFDEQYETWSFALRHADGGKTIQVFAMPAGQIACLNTYWK